MGGSFDDEVGPEESAVLEGYDAEDVAAVFGRAADVYDTVIPFFARFGTRLVEFADLRAGESVLDVGPGRGATLIPAAERVGPNGLVVGVDLSKEMVALLRRDVEQLGLRNTSVLRMDAEALELEPGSFDVAVSSFVLHLLRRPQKASEEIWRVLRPGGRLVASAPMAVGPHWEFLGHLFARFAPRALRPMPMPFRPNFDLASVAQASGFHVLQSIAEEIEFSFPDEQAWWRWAWSAGMRALFESLTVDDLQLVRSEALGEVGALRGEHGISLRQRARFVVAHKPT